MSYTGCSESVSRYVRDVETLGSIPSTPTMERRSEIREFDLMCEGCFFRGNKGGCRVQGVNQAVQIQRAMDGQCDQAARFENDEIVSVVRIKKEGLVWLTEWKME